MPIEALKALYSVACSIYGSIKTNQGVFWQLLPKPGLVHSARHSGVAVHAEDHGDRVAVVGRLVIGDGQPELLEIVGALSAPRGFARGLHGRQE